MISINKQRINRNILIIIFSVFFAVSISGAASAANLSTTVSSNHTIGVNVNYEYASDSAINPEIKVKSATGAKINSTKIYKQAYKCYEVSFTYLGSLNDSKFNVIVSAPGYKT